MGFGGRFAGAEVGAEDGVAAPPAPNTRRIHKAGMVVAATFKTERRVKAMWTPFMNQHRDVSLYYDVSVSTSHSKNRTKLAKIGFRDFQVLC